MNCFRILLLSLLAVCVARNTLATASNPNPNLTIAIVDDQGVTLRPSSIRHPGLAVRVTDPQGLPIAGSYQFPLM